MGVKVADGGTGVSVGGAEVVVGGTGVSVGGTEVAARGTGVAVGTGRVAVAVGRAGVGVARSESGVLHQVFRNVFVAQEVGLLNFHLLDLARHVRYEVARLPPSDEHVRRVSRWFRWIPRRRNW